MLVMPRSILNAAVVVMALTGIAAPVVIALLGPVWGLVLAPLWR